MSPFVNNDTGLAQNADDLFGAVGFAFYERDAIGLRNTHIKIGSTTIEGHAKRWSDRW